ncbi:LacI family DNA-binding transcriptional regulator [Paenibacillus qinlingensis]|uniref:DNA-binding LacI/PurR family transcriptional regulator n=1 Tax=Paenibacillus qinlingensis TaxID=1837343 RepID=A0ABU1NUS9_9BACL|nr:LacI family DNA-binding transcriptional regulator [Paenibacillus qinlingensis]MDR6550836.1 DNA-binding LacI/PurR family transcriptional regulator [Paenibacillus qinlingensis]
MRKKQPTQADVAKLAGVSQSTVSIILNPQGKDHLLISEETREKVQAAIQELGYVINPAARTLAGGQNRLMGVFINGSAFPLDQHGFYHPYLVGIEEACIRHDYDMLLFTRSDGGEGVRRIYRNGLNHLRIADGSILLGLENKEELARLMKEEYPFVFIGKREVPDGDISYVAADYFRGTQTILSRMMALGHRQTGFFYRLYNDATKDRERGYHAALAENYHSSVTHMKRQLTVQEITPAFCRDVLDAGVTAILMEEPAMAHAFAEGARQIGRTCPDDFSIAALSDNDLAYLPTQVAQELVMINIPKLAMGAAAVHMLNQLIVDRNKAHDAIQMTIPVTISGGSTIGTVRVEEELQG